MGDPRAECHVVDSAEGRYLFVVDGSRLYRLPPGAELSGEDLDALVHDLTPESGRRIGAAPLAPPPVQSLSLNLAQACNMGCGYCYAGQGKFGGRAERMSEVVAKAAVDRLVAESRPDVDLVLGFMGGEPFLHRELLRTTVEYAVDRAAATARRIRFSVTTNATLLEDDDVRLLRDHRFHVAISVDGAREFNDAQRPLLRGGSSYDAVRAALERFARIGRPRHLSARATVGARTRGLLGTLTHLVGLGFDSVGFSPVLVSPDPRFQFEPEDFTVFLEEMIRCGEAAKRALLAKKSFPFSNFETALHEIHRGTHRPYPCGAGAAYLSVAADGGLYACHRLVRDERFAMGDVRQGSDVARRALHLTVSHVDRQEPCSSCWARYLCGGGCYHEVVNRGRPACDWIRGWLDFCLASYTEIAARRPEVFDDRPRAADDAWPGSVDPVMEGTP